MQRLQHRNDLFLHPYSRIGQAGEVPTCVGREMHACESKREIKQQPCDQMRDVVISEVGEEVTSWLSSKDTLWAGGVSASACGMLYT